MTCEWHPRVRGTPECDETPSVFYPKKIMFSWNLPSRILLRGLQKLPPTERSTEPAAATLLPTCDAQQREHAPAPVHWSLLPVVDHQAPMGQRGRAVRCRQLLRGVRWCLGVACLASICEATEQPHAKHPLSPGARRGGVERDGGECAPGGGPWRKFARWRIDGRPRVC